jgi:hypothetical protein
VAAAVRGPPVVVDQDRRGIRGQLEHRPADAGPAGSNPSAVRVLPAPRGGLMGRGWLTVDDDDVVVILDDEGEPE